MNITEYNPAPIVLFVYKRPEHTRQTVEALQQNTLAAKSELIIYSDAARNEKDAVAVREVRKYVHAIAGFKSVMVIEQDKNLGLANSVIAGVTEVVSRYGRAIILEDDLVVTAGFLQYMNAALEKYEHVIQVMQISGYMFPVEVEEATDTMFYPLTTSWGWATWKRAWDRFDAGAAGYSKLREDRLLRRGFNLEGAYDYYAMLEGQVQGHIDSWAIRWQLSAFLHEGLTLYPRYSMVFNAGFDGSGTHGVMRGLLSQSGVRADFQPRNFPDSIQVSSSWVRVREGLRTRMPLCDRIMHLVRRQLHVALFTFLKH